MSSINWADWQHGYETHAELKARLGLVRASLGADEPQPLGPAAKLFEFTGYGRL